MITELMEPMVDAGEQAAIVLIQCIATDNLPNRSGMRIPAGEFPALARLLRDKPASVGHPWSNPLSNWGRITDTALLVFKDVPAGLSKADKKSIAGEGYQQILLTIAVQTGHPYLEEFACDRLREVSIAFAYSQMRCPGCDCGKDIYPSYGCPRLPDTQPYIERFGINDAFEVSLVAIPAVRSARVVFDDVYK